MVSLRSRVCKGKTTRWVETNPPLQLMLCSMKKYGAPFETTLDYLSSKIWISHGILIAAFKWLPSCGLRANLTGIVDLDSCNRLGNRQRQFEQIADWLPCSILSLHRNDREMPFLETHVSIGLKSSDKLLTCQHSGSHALTSRRFNLWMGHLM